MKNISYGLNRLHPSSLVLSHYLCAFLIGVWASFSWHVGWRSLFWSLVVCFCVLICICFLVDQITCVGCVLKDFNCVRMISSSLSFHSLIGDLKIKNVYLMWCFIVDELFFVHFYMQKHWHEIEGLFIARVHQRTLIIILIVCILTRMTSIIDWVYKIAIFVYNLNS